MSSDWERGYAAGYRAAHDTDVRDLTSDRGDEKPRKRTRRSTSGDKAMSRALAQVNKKARKSNGDFRKGWNQSRVMTAAHKIRRKNG